MGLFLEVRNRGFWSRVEGFGGVEWRGGCACLVDLCVCLGVLMVWGVGYIIDRFVGHLCSAV